MSLARKSAARGRQLTGVMVALLVAAGAAGCTSAPREVSPLLTDALANETQDDRAHALCVSVYPDHGFLATLDSTSGEVRSIATPAPGGTRTDVDTLPETDDAFVAICIDELPADNLLHSDYIALWLTDNAEGAGIVSAWT